MPKPCSLCPHPAAHPPIVDDDSLHGPYAAVPPRSGARKPAGNALCPKPAAHLPVLDDDGLYRHAGQEGAPLEVQQVAPVGGGALQGTAQGKGKVLH